MREEQEEEEEEVLPRQQQPSQLREEGGSRKKLATTVAKAKNVDAENIAIKKSIFDRLGPQRRSGEELSSTLDVAQPIKRKTLPQRKIAVKASVSVNCKSHTHTRTHTHAHTRTHTHTHTRTHTHTCTHTHMYTHTHTHKKKKTTRDDDEYVPEGEGEGESDEWDGDEGVEEGGDSVLAERDLRENEMDTIARKADHTYFLRSLLQPETVPSLQGARGSSSNNPWSHSGSSTDSTYGIPALSLPVPPVPKKQTSQDIMDALEARDEEMRKSKSPVITVYGHVTAFVTNVHVCTYLCTQYKYGAW